MKIDIKKKAVTLDYVTDIFVHPFQVEGDWNTQEDKREFYTREVPTQLEVELNLTDRSTLPIQCGSTRRPEWYVIYVNHYDHLNPDGTYRALRAHYQAIDIHTYPYSEKNATPDIEAKMREAFPNHNIGLKINIHSALKPENYPSDHYDIRDVFRPVLQEVIQYLVEQGKKEITKK